MDRHLWRRELPLPVSHAKCAIAAEIRAQLKQRGVRRSPQALRAVKVRRSRWAGLAQCSPWEFNVDSRATKEILRQDRRRGSFPLRITSQLLRKCFSRPASSAHLTNHAAPAMHGTAQSRTPPDRAPRRRVQSCSDTSAQKTPHHNTREREGQHDGVEARLSAGSLGPLTTRACLERHTRRIALTHCPLLATQCSQPGRALLDHGPMPRAA